jgi:hypothetical protein
MLKTIHEQMYDGRTRSYLEMNLLIPLQLGRSLDEIIDAASHLGRKYGRDEDWVPESLEEAACEILLYAGGLDAARQLGVVPRLDLKERQDNLFCVTIVLYLHDTPDRIINAADQLCPGGEVEDLPSACLSILMSDVSPLDCELEIKDIRTDLPPSNHERMAREERILASRALTKRKTNAPNQEITSA